MTFSEEGKYKILFRKLIPLSRYETLALIYFRLPWEGGGGGGGLGGLGLPWVAVFRIGSNVGSGWSENLRFGSGWPENLRFGLGFWVGFWLNPNFGLAWVFGLLHGHSAPSAEVWALHRAPELLRCPSGPFRIPLRRVLQNKISPYEEWWPRGLNHYFWGQ